ncbi:LOW QUALITY PROTEIN: pyroglutamylated RF-amide peptide receptor [Megaptera novaeangliae]
MLEVPKDQCEAGGKGLQEAGTKDAERSAAVTKQWSVHAHDLVSTGPHYLKSPPSIFIALCQQMKRIEIKYNFLYEKEHICCLEEWTSPGHQKIYTTFILVILFLLPLTVMLIPYSKISYELWIKKRVGDGSVLRTIHGKEMSKIARSEEEVAVMMVTVVALFAVCWAPFHIVHMMTEYSNFEKEYDEVTIKMIFAVVQKIGFSNSICNPIVYALMNENFKKNFLSAVYYCIVKETLSPARRRGNSGITMMQKKAKFSQKENKGEAFSDGNIEVKLCEQHEEKKHLKRHLSLFDSELSEISALGSGHSL